MKKRSTPGDHGDHVTPDKALLNSSCQTSTPYQPNLYSNHLQPNNLTPPPTVQLCIQYISKGGFDLTRGGSGVFPEETDATTASRWDRESVAMGDGQADMVLMG